MPRAVPSDRSSPEASPSDLRRLVLAARRVRRHAHAPYSRFAVGAAVLSEEGGVYIGCNVENSSYGVTICAERSAIAAAVAGGARRLVAVAVVTAMAPPGAPCGVCLQSLSEFMGPEGQVVLAGATGAVPRTSVRLGDLFPRAFQLRPAGLGRRR